VIKITDWGTLGLDLRLGLFLGLELLLPLGLGLELREGQPLLLWAGFKSLLAFGLELGSYGLYDNFLNGIPLQ
jgi:hypothetical protein